VVKKHFLKLSYIQLDKSINPPLHTKKRKTQRKRKRSKARENTFSSFSFLFTRDKSFNRPWHKKKRKLEENSREKRKGRKRKNSRQGT
jgi:hypothetical protein